MTAWVHTNHHRLLGSFLPSFLSRTASPGREVIEEGRHPIQLLAAPSGRSAVRGRRSSVLRMDQSRKRAREGEQDVQQQARGTTTTTTRKAARQLEEVDDVAAEVADALMNGRGAIGEDEPWQRPPGVFELPWQKYRGGLGLASSAAGGGGPELRDVFFRSLVDGGAATIGVPGDRLTRPAASKTLTPKLFEDVEAWLASADDDEVEPMWRSALAGPRAGAEDPRVTPK